MARAGNGTDLNQIGQVMGRKGQDTRARLVAAAAHLVATRPLRDLRVSDIARQAGVGAPTFYVYFSDVDAAVLAALEQHPQSAPEILELLDRDWSAPDGRAHIHAFVKAYLGLWKENYALLRARNLAADEGDERFVRQRMADISPILGRLTAKFQAAQDEGAIASDVSPRAAAGVISAALERLASARHWTPGEVSDAQLEDAAVFVLASALGLPSAAITSPT